ncbi:MAG TPA: septum formation inhibitor Maf [Chromatiales bacterium]|nr:septum formation inhibitor Maf [Chromatiales bacterium]
MRTLVLASSSPYRRALLQRLGVAFRTARPEVDETPLPGEPPAALVRRLAEAKARALAERFPEALIIGSDQCAVTDESRILGKPGDFEHAYAQLRALSGRSVRFLTGLCLLEASTGTVQLDVVPFLVEFRHLSDAQIRRYLQRERPFDCAGSFRSEGLGIALFRRMQGDDPNALIGLPLIRLVDMLEAAGQPVL